MSFHRGVSIIGNGRGKTGAIMRCESMDLAPRGPSMSRSCGESDFPMSVMVKIMQSHYASAAITRLAESTIRSISRAGGWAIPIVHSQLPRATAITHTRTDCGHLKFWHGKSSMTKGGIDELGAADLDRRRISPLYAAACRAALHPSRPSTDQPAGEDLAALA